MDSALQKVALEVCQYFQQGRRRLDGREEWTSGENFGHLRKIIPVVGSQINVSAGLQRLPGEMWKPLIDQAMFVMFSFWPRVGKINMNGLGRVRRKQIFQEIGRFNAHAAQIGQPGAPAFAVDFAQAAQQPFHADKISFGMQRGVLHQERAVAAAENRLRNLASGHQIGGGRFFLRPDFSGG